MDRDVIETVGGSLTQERLAASFAQLGIRPGAVLAVHSSLSSLGHVIGGADTVIAALLEAVGPDGAIVMPAYTVSLPVPLSDDDVALGLAWKVRLLPAGARDVRSGMGVIADRFRDQADVILGTQPIHRLAAWGRDAAVLVEGYERLLERDGLVLLLGVDMDRCSALHLAEARVGLPEVLRQRMRPPEGTRHAYPADEWAVGYRVPFVNYNRVRQVADSLGLIRAATVGEATARLFEASAMVALFERLRRERPESLIDDRYRR